MTNNDLNDSLGSVLIVDNQVFRYEEKQSGLQHIGPDVRTLFIIKHEEDTPTHTAFIHSIAKACNLGEGAYEIIPRSCGWKDLRQFDNIREVILMGVSERELDLLISIPVHYVYNFDGRNWIRTMDVTTLKLNNEAKSTFWKEVLKPYFLG